MSGEVILKSHEIVKHFGQTHALNGISVELHRGEIIGLIGENGSGKSTFSSIISGVYPPTSGSLELKGQPYKPANPVCNRVAWVTLLHLHRLQRLLSAITWHGLTTSHKLWWAPGLQIKDSLTAIVFIIDNLNKLI